MIVTTKIKVLSAKKGSFTGKNGQVRDTHKLVYSQNFDEIVGEINVKQEVYETCVKGNEYTLIGEYLTTKNGNYISWVSAKPILNNGKATTV